MRRITTRGDGPTLLASDVVQSLFVSEILSPSRDVWLLSPWISDIPVIDNRAGAFTGMFPGMTVRMILLTDALIELAMRGSHVHVIVRPDPRNMKVTEKLATAAGTAVPIEIVEKQNLHEKALLTSRFHLYGSMNFTHYGREVNEEALVLDTDADNISRANLDYHERFGTR
ncbi:phospholipase D-like domain-containing protein DpdK [Rhodococcus zopfii]|uniref:phospholipase D-like domain-containing protein DpdK n=1 Tax=Rhodococcus zopfii TaxID=43772 RepID=UPI00365E133B